MFFPSELVDRAAPEEDGVRQGGRGRELRGILRQRLPVWITGQRDAGFGDD
jgi:hypothetical protein